MNPYSQEIAELIHRVKDGVVHWERLDVGELISTSHLNDMKGWVITLAPWKFAKVTFCTKEFGSSQQIEELLKVVTIG